MPKHLCDVMSEKNCSLNGHVHYPQLSIEKTPVDIAKKNRGSWYPLNQTFRMCEKKIL